MTKIDISSLLMLFLTLVLEIRITTLKQGGFYGLNDASDHCNIHDEIYNNKRIADGSCNVSINISYSNFSNCFYSGLWTYGGAVYIKSLLSARLFMNRFKNMSADSYGGAIYFYNVPEIKAENNTFIKCHSTSGGAVVYFGNSGTFSRSNTYSNTHATTSGGVIFLDRVSSKESSNFIDEQFDNCHSEKDNGGAFYAYSSPSLEISLSRIILLNCYISGSDGGAMAFDNIKGITIDTVKCEDCYSKLGNGGVLYINTIPKESTIWLSNLHINNCYTSNLGGAIYVENSINLDIKASSFINCSSSDGGAIHLKGGEFFAIGSCNFSNCKSINENGGAISLDKTFTSVMIKFNSFKSCNAGTRGAAFYYIGAGSANKIDVYSEGNVFNDCQGKLSGAFYINSYNDDTAQFVSDKFINCKSTSAQSNSGGGILCEIHKSAGINISNCLFLECFSNISGGGIGFNFISTMGFMKIKILGCDFEKCNSKLGACISIQKLTEPKLFDVTLKITDYRGKHSTFKNIKGFSNNYSIYANARDVEILNSDFEDVGIGALKVSDTCQKICIRGSRFIKCDSSNYIFTGQKLSDFIVQNTSIENCGSCYQIKSTNVSLSSLAIIGSTYHHESPSTIACDSISITNITMKKSKEAFKINIKNMTLKSGTFSESSQAIEIESPVRTAVVLIDSLAADEALMFTLSANISNFTIQNSIGTYHQVNNNGNIIYSNAATTNVINCTFTTGESASIVLAGSKSSLINSTLIGDNTIIKVDSELTIKNNNIKSKNGPAIDIQTKGLLIIFTDTNCIFSPKGLEILNWEGKIMDSDKNPLDSYQNNESCVRDPTEQFSLSKNFEPTQNFIETSNFSYTISFSQSNEFLPSKIIISEIVQISSETEHEKIVENTNQRSISSIIHLPEENQGYVSNSKKTVMLVGITAGSIAVVILIIVIVVYLACRKRDKSTDDIKETELETELNPLTSSITDGSTPYTTQMMPATTWMMNNTVADEDPFKIDFEEVT